MEIERVKIKGINESGQIIEEVCLKKADGSFETEQSYDKAISASIQFSKDITEEDWQRLERESKKSFDRLGDALEQFNKNLIEANNRLADYVVLHPKNWLQIRSLKIKYDRMMLPKNRAKRRAKARKRSRGYIAHGRHK